MKTVKRVFATTVVAIATASAAWAMEATEETSFGIVSGQVTDAENHTLPGATVQIESLHTGVTADINGFYKLPNLKPGTYTMKVALATARAKEALGSLPESIDVLLSANILKNAMGQEHPTEHSLALL